MSSYADALAHFDKQTVKVQPGKAPGDSNITAVNVSVKEAGKPDIFLEFKLRKNNKTLEDKLNQGLSEVMKDGTYKALSTKYFQLVNRCRTVNVTGYQ